MGDTYDVVCERCGKRINLSWGMGFVCGWGDPELIARIKDGKYGKKAKEAYESHDGALCHLEQHPFICGCGYLKTYRNLVIMSNDLSDPDFYFVSEHRCPRCRKKMRPLRDEEGIRCPDCKGRMMEDPASMILWD